MALNGLVCADVPLSNYSLTLRLPISSFPVRSDIKDRKRSTTERRWRAVKLDVASGEYQDILAKVNQNSHSPQWRGNVPQKEGPVQQLTKTPR